MHRFCLALLLIVVSGGPLLAQRAAQLPSRPDHHPLRPDRRRSNNSTTVVTGDSGGYGYGSPYMYTDTPVQGALEGAADVISSKGNYNLSTSEAAINMTLAQRNEIENHQIYENTYFQMRQSHDAYMKKEAGPRPTEETLVRIAREGDPQGVSPSEVSPTSGKINWPDVLQEDRFSAERNLLDQLSEKKAAHGSLSITDQMAARKTIESMYAGMKSQISELPPQDYVASKEFLRSIIYALAHSQLE